MPENRVYDIVFDLMLKEAVAANFHNKMSVMPSEEEILKEHPFSDNHIHKMNKLFAIERRTTYIRSVISVAKIAMLVVCVIAALTFSLLLTSPQVRAAVQDAIVKFYEGFTSVAFVDTDKPDKAAQGFSPSYIPKAYSLASSEAYGENSIAIYMDADENMLMLEVSPSGFFAVDNEYLTYYTEVHDGVTYHIHESPDKEHFSFLLWTNDGFSFCLNGVIHVEELLKTARSVEYFMGQK